jgi:hypothetical protein
VTSRIREGRAGDVADAAGLSPPSAGKFAKRLLSTMLLFGVIGALVSSRFPIGLGLLLFFSDDEFVEWVLRKLGIRLVPDTLGGEFIKCLAFMAGWAALLFYWKDSAPAWLISGAAPHPLWPVVAGTALVCAVAKLLSAAIVRKGLPWAGIAIAPGGFVSGGAELLVLSAVLGLLVLLVSFTSIPDWLGNH